MILGISFSGFVEGGSSGVKSSNASNFQPVAFVDLFPNAADKMASKRMSREVKLAQKVVVVTNLFVSPRPVHDAPQPFSQVGSRGLRMVGPHMVRRKFLELQSGKRRPPC